MTRRDESDGRGAGLFSESGRCSLYAPREWIAICIGSSLLVLACYYPVLGYGWTDVDTLMNVAAARVDGAADLVGVALGKLTGGRAGLQANFYRPVVMSCTAALRGVFGWTPIAFHIFDLLLHATCGVLVVAFASRVALRFGLPRPRSFSLWVGGAFLLHPIGQSVVPAIARNGDLLMTGFLLGGMLAADRSIGRLQPSSDSVGIHSFVRQLRASDGLATSVVAFALLSLLALASKESGVVLLAIAPIYLLFARSGAGLGQTVGLAALLVGPAAALGAGFLALRSHVLAELVGGYHLALSPWDTAKIVASYLYVDLSVPGFSTAVERMLPLAAPLELLDTLWLSVAITAAVVMLGAIVTSRAPITAPALRLTHFVLWVFIVFGGLFASAQVYDRRLLYPALPFFCLLLGLVFDGAAARVAGAIARREAAAIAGARALHVIAAATAAVLVLWQSPLSNRDIEWREAGLAAHLMTDEIAPRWAALPVGSRVLVVNLAAGFDLDPARRIAYTSISSTNALSADAIQAWLDDQLPDRKLRVRSLGSHRYREALHAFRHQVAVRRGGLEYRAPVAQTNLDAVLALRRGFVLESLAEGRMRLTPTTSAPGAFDYLLVMDGADPKFVRVDALRAQVAR